MPHPPRPNRVLPASYLPSQNFWQSDLSLQDFVQRFISEEARQYMEDKWQQLGQRAAVDMDALSLQADKHGPELIRRNFLGEDVFDVRFHPAYEQLMAMAVESEMFRVKWEPELRQQFQAERHRTSFVNSFLYAMGEGGIPCPLCMTDGAARLVDRFCTEEDRQRILPHLYTLDPKELYTGAMFLTEKSGGSDVGANLVRAEQEEGSKYRLYGEKWFCSNVNADIIFVLARVNPEIRGTRGLSIFLVEKRLPDGSKNPLEILRLKDKLGVRSMASAECMLNGTIGTLIGEEGEGFRIMTDMINLSRLYNAAAALSFARRALIEAYQYLCHRVTFGQKAISHSLVRAKLGELGARYLADFYFLWDTIMALDHADQEDEQAGAALRLLTPMLKKGSAEQGVYLVRESMELMGGMGYIEDGVMPKLMRDVLVLPIWEGAGNIMVLDMLRAWQKPGAWAVTKAQIEAAFQGHFGIEHAWKTSWEALLTSFEKAFALPQDESVYQTKRALEKLTDFHRMACLLRYQTEASTPWIAPALAWWESQLFPEAKPAGYLPDEASLHQLLAWKA
ncbi:MAG: acyl-CoA dehydrogenase family protein [Bacteroidota bacterium]